MAVVAETTIIFLTTQPGVARNRGWRYLPCVRHFAYGDLQGSGMLVWRFLLSFSIIFTTKKCTQKTACTVQRSSVQHCADAFAWIRGRRARRKMAPQDCVVNHLHNTDHACVRRCHLCSPPALPAGQWLLRRVSGHRDFLRHFDVFNLCVLHQQYQHLGWC